MDKIKAKDASLIAKLIGVVIILGGSVLKWTGIFENCSIQDVCLVGFAVMGMFGTVDINIMLDKIFNKTVSPNKPEAPENQA